jgi:pimeloyl-ACP methyl ester carboxylesterase
MPDCTHVVLIHGTWGRGDSWAPARAAFEGRGYTVHTPTLRHHELPLQDGAEKVAAVSMRDYTDDLVSLVESLDSPPLLVGLSLGGLLAQLVAARARHAGVVAACPSPAAGIFAPTPSTVRTFASVFGTHFIQPKPWAKPLYPTDWQRFRRWIANTQTDEDARGFFADLVCDSGRAYCEIVFPFLDRGNATTVDFATVTTPVLTLRAEHDLLVPPQIARKTAARYRYGTCVDIAGSDHLVFSGDALATTMGHIDAWIAGNRGLFAS